MERSLTIELGERSYPIHIGSGILATTGTLIRQHLEDVSACLVVADDNVAALYGPALMASLAAAGLRAEMVTFPPGEPEKSLANAERLWCACAAMHLDRRGAVVALGGGVCGDLAGFVAATWMRGLRLVQLPTTLLAMVDSSVGGKTAVNSPAGKNLIGAFHQPSLVVADIATLASMQQREYRAGLAEVVKYGVIHDAEFFAWQETHAAALAAGVPAMVEEAVQRSCAIKAWYVANDEREQGARAHLNYGHTFGHALEGETAYRRYLHGEAVAIGMRMAAACASKLGLLCDGGKLIARQDALLHAMALPDSHQLADQDELERLQQRCLLDKKTAAGRVRFILPTALGQVQVVSDPDPEAVRWGFAAGCRGPQSQGCAAS